MIIPRIIPCLLLASSGLVKTVKFKDPKYIGDIINTVRIFNEKEVDEIVILDIKASLENRPPNYTLLKDIATECFMPLCYGGGIRSVDEIKKLFELGIEKISLNSSVFDDSQLISQASNAFGSQSIVISIDIKRNMFGNYSVNSHSGSKDRKVDPVDFAKKVEGLGAGEILVTSIDRDGTRQGYDLDIINRISSAVGIPVIACGGANNLEDCKKVLLAGAAGAAAGSFFVLHGKHRAVLVSYPDRSKINNLLKD
jgi:imidazole glycerol-phosphate synthase subunit HisF